MAPRGAKVGSFLGGLGFGEPEGPDGFCWFPEERRLSQQRRFVRLISGWWGGVSRVSAHQIHGVDGFLVAPSHQKLGFTSISGSETRTFHLGRRAVLTSPATSLSLVVYMETTTKP